MTKKLENLFNLDSVDDLINEDNSDKTIDEIKQEIVEIDAAADKIDAALPQIRDLSMADIEFDEVALQAHKAFEDTMNLSMNIEAKYSARMMEVAGQFLSAKLSAKNAKFDKKLKAIDLQLKKMKLDQDKNKDDPTGGAVEADGEMLDRNRLLEELRSKES